MWTPPPSVTGTFSCVLVTVALLALTSILAVGSPTVVIAGALAGQIVTLAIRITVASSLAVRAPELGRALC